MKLGMVSLFHPHSMYEIVERVTTKIGSTSCTKLDYLFRSIRVSGENSSVTPTLIFLNLLQLQTFFACIVHHSKPHHQIFNLFMTSFAVFQSFTELFKELNDLKLKITTKWTVKMLKFSMVSSFHPHSMCERVERVAAKTGRTSCTNWIISFGVSGFRTRTHLLHGHFNVI